MSSKSSPLSVLAKDVSAFVDKRDLADPPPGCPLRTPEEKHLWRSIVSCRPRTAWNDIDLFMAYKVVLAQTEIMEHKAAIKDEGLVMVSEVGRPFINPRQKLVDTLESRLIVYMSRLHLLHPPVGGSTMRGSVLRSNRAAEVIDMAKSTGLLAIPGGE